MAFSHVSRPIRDVTGKTFARKFITLGKVINYWAEAVGPELAAKSYPVGMAVRKNPKVKTTTKTAEKSQVIASSRDMVATLEIAASSAEATLIHYQKKMILERLGLLIGPGLVVDIKIVHNAAATLAPSIPCNFPLTAKPNPCLSPEQAGTDKIADDELRVALERLSRYIETQNNQQKS